jgi:hypothetical protein
MLATLEEMYGKKWKIDRLPFGTQPIYDNNESMCFVTNDVSDIRICRIIKINKKWNIWTNHNGNDYIWGWVKINFLDHENVKELIRGNTTTHRKD